MKCASSRTNAGGLAALALAALLAIGGECRADYLAGSWIAQDVKGVLYPPAYGLRLDGLFGGSDAVTFSFSPDVQFTAAGDGSASLTGVITVNHNAGAAAGNGTSWLLDVQFSESSDNGTLHFYDILAGSKMTLVGDPTTEVRFRNTVTMDMPFQVGPGAVEDKPAYPYRTNNVNSAAGWVDFQRSGALFDGMADPNGELGGLSDTGPWYHTGSNDFLFELTSADCQPVPAPGALALGLVGAAGLAFYRRCRRGAE